MKVISTATLKGGTGKTMTCFDVSSILAEEGKKVLVIDCDPQANITSNLGIDAEDMVSIKEIFEKDISPKEVIISKPIDDLPTLDIIPSNIFLTTTEMQIISFTGRELLLKNYINSNLEFFNQYDYIFIDTNPSMSVINQNAFIVSDAIILVNEVGFNSLAGSELFIRLWSQIAKRIGIKNNIKGFVINRFDKRNKLSNEFLEHCKGKEYIKDVLFNTVIPVNIKLTESELSNTPINLYDKHSTGYKAYYELTKEIVERV